MTDKKRGKYPLHYVQYETSMKEQGTKRKMGAKQLQRGTRRVEEMSGKEGKGKESREGTEEYRISLSFMSNAGD